DPRRDHSVRGGDRLCRVFGVGAPGGSERRVAPARAVRLGGGGLMASGGVEIRGLTKRFEDAVAVDSIDASIEAGEFFSLLGPSGCGKTTTLRMIAGFEQPTAGQIVLDGVDVAAVPPHERNVHTVFQSYALFPHLDLFGNVAFGLRRRRVGKEE